MHLFRRNIKFSILFTLDIADHTICLFSTLFFSAFIDDDEAWVKNNAQNNI
jgi:hypothetical protein